MASKTNLPSLIDMVLEYKLGRTNQVADALSRRSWRHLSVRQWQPPAGSRVPYRIVFEMGLKKDPREAFCTKLRNAKQKKDRVRVSLANSRIKVSLFNCISSSPSIPAREEPVGKEDSFKLYRNKASSRKWFRYQLLPSFLFRVRLFNTRFKRGWGSKGIY